MTVDSSVSAGPASDPSRRVPSTVRARGPLGALLDLFSNVRFGIVLLTLLFFYCSIGSAGVVYPIHPNIFSADAWVHAQLRQWRPFEMTEFEWFHWWPFNLLILLICLNLIVTTIRRIRFNAINLGVWTIHTGIVILCIGSVIYFARKVEGDAPIARRQVVATVETPSGPRRVSLVAAPGNRTVLEADGAAWTLEVASIDPSWEIRTGDDAGRRAYSVNVLVNGPGGRFMRQLLAGYPAYTEDVLFTDDAEQPMQRAVKATGRPLVDESLSLALEYEPARYFYLKSDADKSWALYVRRPGDRAWTERPIEGLPLYNDFIASRDDVIQAPGDPPLPIDPIDVVVPPAGPDDPFPDLRFRVTSYLRYATERSSLEAGPAGSPFNPAIDFTLALRPEPGAPQRPGRDYRMLALDPVASRADEGLLRFKAVRTAAERDALMLPPTLEFQVPGQGIALAVPVSALSIVDPALPFTALGESGYSWRVRTVEDDVPLASGSAAVAIVELRGPKGEFTRWVFDDQRLTRDVADPKAADAHGPASLIDDAIQVRYLPGAGRAVLTVVAGPGEEEIGAIVARSGQPVEFKPLAVGRPTEISDGLSLLPRFFSPRGVLSTKPFVVPREQRMRDAGEFFAKIKLEVEGTRASFPGGVPWLAFHRYPFEVAEHALRRFPYAPTTVSLPDGRQVEVLFSRQRRPLPAPVVLEEFVLDTHTGGFTGEATTIRNYTSVVRFEDVPASREGGAATPGGAAATWSEPLSVSVNDPIERDGWWFFQAQWDPPDEARGSGRAASAGLNYTVLGVGNREGVWIQLFGCVVAVLGMIYAFYVKPILKRRRERAVRAQVEAMAARGELPSSRGVRPAAATATAPASARRSD